MKMRNVAFATSWNKISLKFIICIILFQVVFILFQVKKILFWIIFYFFIVFLSVLFSF